MGTMASEIENGDEYIFEGLIHRLVREHTNHWTGSVQVALAIIVNFSSFIITKINFCFSIILKGSTLNQKTQLNLWLSMTTKKSLKRVRTNIFKR